MFKPEKIKLPLFKGSRRHVLLIGLDEVELLDGLNMSAVARSMNVTPQTLWVWKNRAKQSRNFLLPAEQVPALSRTLGIPPYYFRPDLWPTPEWRFT
jgi:hypothetical protein